MSNASKEAGFKNLVNIAKDALGLLEGGIFLTTKGEAKSNTMIISWGMIGQMWNKPVIMVMVRPSRYSHDLLESKKEFTVTLPKAGVAKDHMKIAGSESGLTVDKIAKMDLTLIDSRAVSVPTIQMPGIHLECKLMFKSEMLPEGIVAPEGFKNLYPDGDYHTLYFAEIVEINQTN